MATKQQRKTWDDFLNGTFTSGGIFDEPAKVKFAETPKPPPRITLPPKLDPTRLTPQEEALAAKIRKIQAVIDDDRAPEAIRDNARRAKEKLLKGVKKP